MRYGVYGQSLGALYTGSLTSCVRFIAYAMKGVGGYKSLTIHREAERRGRR